MNKEFENVSAAHKFHEHKKEVFKVHPHRCRCQLSQCRLPYNRLTARQAADKKSNNNRRFCLILSLKCYKMNANAHEGEDIHKKPTCHVSFSRAALT